MPRNKWDIEGNDCKLWAISTPATENGADDLIWSTQVTALLPFEGINDLFAAALVTPVTSPLILHQGFKEYCVCHRAKFPVKPEWHLAGQSQV